MQADEASDGTKAYRAIITADDDKALASLASWTNGTRDSASEVSIARGLRRMPIAVSCVPASKREFVVKSVDVYDDANAKVTKLRITQARPNTVSATWDIYDREAQGDVNAIGPMSIGFVDGSLEVSFLPFSGNRRQTVLSFGGKQTKLECGVMSVMVP